MFSSTCRVPCIHCFPHPSQGRTLQTANATVAFGRYASRRAATALRVKASWLETTNRCNSHRLQINPESLTSPEPMAVLHGLTLERGSRQDVPRHQIPHLQVTRILGSMPPEEGPCTSPAIYFDQPPAPRCRMRQEWRSRALACMTVPASLVVLAEAATTAT